MIENFQITRLDRILMDGCLCCLAVGPAEILYESIGLQGLSHDPFLILFNSTQLKGEYKKVREVERGVGNDVKNLCGWQTNFFFHFSLSVINCDTILNATQRTASFESLIISS